MMQQYLELKAKHKSCILFLRLGSFRRKAGLKELGSACGSADVLRPMMQQTPILPAH